MRSLFTALTLLPLVSAGACSVYDSSLLLPGTGGATGNSGGGTGAGGDGSGGAQECTLAKYPFLPADEPAGSRNIDFTVAMRSIDFGDDSPKSEEPPRRYRTIGFDLDDSCTSEAEKKVHKPGQCRVPEKADGVTDGPGGIDNALGVIIQFVRSQLRTLEGDDQFSSDLYSANLEKGATSVLIRVSDYNGEPNDRQVKVETWVSSPFTNDPKNKGKMPEWKGEDAFPIASTSVKNDNPADPVFVTSSAYVNDNKIVAGLDELGLLLEVGLSELRPVELELLLTKAAVVCTISPSEYGQGFKLTDCTLSAKWEADHLLKQLSHFPDPLGASQGVGAPPLCSKSSSYVAFKRAICEVVDTAKTGNIRPDTQCDSISMGVRFQTEPAIRGVLDKREPKPEECEPSEGLPSEDSCATFFGTAGAPGSGGAGSGGASNSGGTSGAGGTGGARTGGATGSGGATSVDSGADAGDSGTSDASVN